LSVVSELVEPFCEIGLDAAAVYIVLFDTAGLDLMLHGDKFGTSVEFYLYPTVITALIHLIKPELIM